MSTCAKKGSFSSGIFSKSHSDSIIHDPKFNENFAHAVLESRYAQIQSVLFNNARNCSMLFAWQILSHIRTDFVLRRHQRTTVPNDLDERYICHLINALLKRFDAPIMCEIEYQTTLFKGKKRILHMCRLPLEDISAVVGVSMKVESQYTQADIDGLLRCL